MQIRHINHLSVITCAWHKCRLKVPFVKSVEVDGLRFCSGKCGSAFAEDEKKFNAVHVEKHRIPVLHLLRLRQPRPVRLDFKHFGAD